jgi:DNA-binding beta-propeller fold protein YncE
VHLQGLDGDPFSVVASGSWAFASLTSFSAVGVLRADAAGHWSRVRTIRLPGQGGRPIGLGEALSPDGRYLLVAGGDGASVLSVARAEAGSPDPVVGTLSDPYTTGGIEVTVSRDGRYAFVSMEGSQAIAVFRLHQALTSGFGPSDLAGQIPTGLAPVGLAVSPDGKWLYATSELAPVASPAPPQTAPAGSPAPAGPSASPPTPAPAAPASGATAPGYSGGAVQVMSMARAETSPATSVVAAVLAGCNPVRIVVSASGQVLWATARGSDAVVALSADRLRTDPRRALLGWLRVGEAPVGLALTGDGSRLVVADSNRFQTPGRSASLAVIDTTAALAGQPSLLGYLPAGQFPRDVSLAGGQLLVANYQFSSLETIQVADLP